MSLVTINLHMHADACSDAATRQLLEQIFERIDKVPTAQELKEAVKTAVAEEHAQVMEALAAALAKSAISEEDKAEIIAAIKGVYEPEA